MLISVYPWLISVSFLLGLLMFYRILEDVSIADVAFEARGKML